MIHLNFERNITERPKLKEASCKVCHLITPVSRLTEESICNYCKEDLDA